MCEVSESPPSGGRTPEVTGPVCTDASTSSKRVEVTSTTEVGCPGTAVPGQGARGTKTYKQGTCKRHQKKWEGGQGEGGAAAKPPNCRKSSPSPGAVAAPGAPRRLLPRSRRCRPPQLPRCRRRGQARDSGSPAALPPCLLPPHLLHQPPAPPGSSMPALSCPQQFPLWLCEGLPPKHL